MSWVCWGNNKKHKALISQHGGFLDYKIIIKHILLFSVSRIFFNISEDAIPYLWRRQWHPTPVLLPGKSLGWRSLVGCSPWGRKESDTTEWLHFHFSLSCTGEGNGNPLQCSCLENPRDGGAWWAAIYGVKQSRHDWSDLAAAAAYFIWELYEFSAFHLNKIWQMLRKQVEGSYTLPYVFLCACNHFIFFSIFVLFCFVFVFFIFYHILFLIF